MLPKDRHNYNFPMIFLYAKLWKMLPRLNRRGPSRRGPSRRGPSRQGGGARVEWGEGGDGVGGFLPLKMKSVLTTNIFQMFTCMKLPNLHAMLLIDIDPISPNVHFMPLKK